MIPVDRYLPIRGPRVAMKIKRVFLTAVLVPLVLACPSRAQSSGVGSAGSPKPRLQDYRVAKQKARAWFDPLEIDAVELLANNVKGKKKVAEILGVYMNFQHHTSDPQEIAAIMARVNFLAQQTHRPDYHNMGTCSDRELIQNSMSYFRVMWLMREFGLDTTHYREELLKVQQRMDNHMARRGPWQRAMFGEYYDRFGLEKPGFLENVKMKEGIIARRLTADKYDPPYTDPKTGQTRTSKQNSYDLTHEVFVAYNYGLQRKQDRFSPEDLQYTKEVLPVLVVRYIRENNPDLLAEMLSCMTYLGWHDHPAYRLGIDYLLDVQNPNGTWGSYERWRSVYGKYLDPHVYLHTTMVSMRALMEAYEGNWPAAN